MLGLLQTKIQTGRTTGGNITIEAGADTSKCSVIVDTNNSNGTVSWIIIELGGAI